MQSQLQGFLFFLLKFVLYRIHYVVGNACVKVWATKILSEFQHCQVDAEKAIQAKCEEIMDIHAGLYIVEYNIQTYKAQCM